MNALIDTEDRESIICPTPNTDINSDGAYILSVDFERERRAAMTNAVHIKPLSDYLRLIRERQGEGYDMPAFDPCDGGIQARVLFLLEAPGPKAVGSAFISRNNPDPTARNLCELLAESGIARQDTVIWNIVPWYVGDGQGRIRAVTRQDIDEALPYLDDLLALLSNLQVIVLVGQKAQSAAKDIRTRTNLPFVNMPHPSARVFNVWPEKRSEAAKALSTVSTLLKRTEAGK